MSVVGNGQFNEFVVVCSLQYTTDGIHKLLQEKGFEKKTVVADPSSTTILPVPNRGNLRRQ